MYQGSIKDTFCPFRNKAMLGFFNASGSLCIIRGTGLRSEDPGLGSPFQVGVSQVESSCLFWLSRIETLEQITEDRHKPNPRISCSAGRLPGAGGGAWGGFGAEGGHGVPRGGMGCRGEHADPSVGRRRAKILRLLLSRVVLMSGTGCAYVIH